METIIYDNQLGDADIPVTATNTTLSDNFMVAFDDDLTAVIGLVASNHKPAGSQARYEATDGGLLVYQYMAASDLEATVFALALLSFSFIANLFREAEYCFEQG